MGELIPRPKRLDDDVIDAEFEEVVSGHAGDPTDVLFEPEPDAPPDSFIHDDVRFRADCLASLRWCDNDLYRGWIVDTADGVHVYLVDDDGLRALGAAKQRALRGY